MSTVILKFTARVLTPIIAVISLYLLLRGHNAPGGGFIAALVAGAAVVLQYFANGLEGVRRFLPVGFTTLLSVGILLAAGVGLVSVLVGGQFLEMAHVHTELPLIGAFDVSSSLVFDVGVYLVVVGMVVAIVRHLGRES